ncbi:MAG: thrombospondin type 3 repeat-containing protein [Gammaproteobacteria bacterium]|nr:thrombospondin type 3 repeat-containing protein [Gammaproteobacteria bacterium]NND59491.1 hypothetical protein [Gammaproteobacteria bacterium]
MHKRCVLGAISALIFCQAQANEAPATQPGSFETITIRGAEVLGPFAPAIFDGDVRDLPTADAWHPGDAVREVPDKKGREVKVTPAKAGPDPLVGRQHEYDRNNAVRGATDLSAPIFTIDAIDYQGINPSDPVLDVGANYVIAAANGSLTPVPGGVFVVYDKNTGALVAGPTKISLLIAQVGTPCASPAGFSDPIVMYDEIAQRWMMAEIGAAVNNTICMYISQTSDPLGGWFGYTIATPVLPDYPKFGIWGDGIYVTTNENLADGSAIYAIDRAQYENGLPITPQRTIPAPASLPAFSFQAFTPADIDGATPPPAGSPNYLVRHRDDEVHNPGSHDPNNDFLEIWEYSVDFLVPANTTITGPINIPVAEFSSEICGLSAFECFRQPGTSTTLDPLREVVMFRWAYRNFGTHETLLGNLVTDVGDTPEHGGIRWIELRRPPAGSWSVYQEGTYSPDDDDRWMGASAMDKDGNIAVTYSVSSEVLHPAIRYTGRRASDPLGVMTQGEISIVESNASNLSNRWGDYADTVVDPVDGCTFWTTNNRVKDNGRWHTVVANFRFASCGDADLDGIANEIDNCPQTANADQADTDSDTVGDACDNCLLEANPDQCNTNGDIYGNVCDADLDNNGIVNSFDLTQLRENFGMTGENDADITCNGVVNSFDLTEMREDFGSAPGPSGLAP